MNPSLLDIDQIHKTFDGVTALHNFTCSVCEREILGIIGPNGAGKTTLFNVVTGFTAPDRGGIALRGKELVGRPPYRIARMGVARTFQDLRLVRRLSVLENVLLSCGDQPGEQLFNVIFHWRRVATKEAGHRKKATSLLGKAGLADKAGELAENLSYGQQKLLGLVCCLAAGADLLLLDEPVAGIAPEMREKMLGLIRELPGEGRSVVLIEHDLDAVMQTCDRVVLMDAGAKISEGTPQEVRSDPKVMEAYID